MSSDAAQPTEEGGEKPSLLPMILLGVNLLAGLSAMGYMVYTKMMFKRAAITEDAERERLTSMLAKPKDEEAVVYMKFDPVTVNIASNPVYIKNPDGAEQQVPGKLHYVTISFVLELVDEDEKKEIELVRAKIMDNLLSMIGKKQIQELTTVQGRYVLRTQIVEMINRLVAEKLDPERDAHSSAAHEDSVLNLFFTNFTVQ